MGTQRIPTRINGQIIDESWFNAITRALTTYFVPRDSSGEVSDIAGSLGTPLLRWLRAFISEGYWSVGDFKYHHSYNGAVGPGEGWMLCDGRTINEANYDTEHGAGSWDTYIGTSPLDGKKLPNLTDKYLVGKATTTQDGSGTISSVGVAGSTIDTRHIHSIYTDTGIVGGGVSPSDTTFDASGNSAAVGLGSAKNGPDGSAPRHIAVPNTGGRGYTMYTAQQGSSAKDIRPDSIETQIYMRII